MLRALEIDGELDEAHLAIGQVSMFYEWKPEKAAQEYKEAIRLNPKNAFARHQYGLCLSVLGKTDQAIYEAEKAMEYEPLSVIGNLQAAAIYGWNDRDEGSLKYANRLIEIAPRFFGGYFMKGFFFLKQGRFDDAISLFNQSASFDNRQGIVKSFLGKAYALAGKKDKAFDCIEELRADLENNKAASYQIAGIYSSIGNLDKTFEWLEKAFEERNGELIYLKLYANWRDGEIWGREFRSDPRFRDLLRRIGFPADKINQTDDSLEAQTVMLRAGEATAEPPAKDSETENVETKPTTEPAINTKSEIQKPESEWRLFGLLTLLLAVGGFFGYKYFAPTKQINSIAVMPFVNESGNSDVEYLSDGMTETLINSLSQIPNLSVKARSSVFRYKGKEIDPKKIAAELNVQAVLTGRVASRGEQIILNLELIDAQTENVLWGNRYERKSSELVSLQSEIARDVSNKLKSKLSDADEQKITKNYTANPEAYQLYLKGKFNWNKRTGATLRQAVEFYNQAIEKDPNYALAYSGLAESYALFSNYSVAPPLDSMPKAKAAGQRAIELDDSLAEPHVALGIYYSDFAWNSPAAKKEFRRAIELNPNYAPAHQQYAIECLSVMSRFDEAVAEGKRAIELDPLSPIIGADLGQILLRARRFDEVIAQINKVIQLDQNFWVAYWYIRQAHHGNGQYREAAAAYRKGLTLSDNPFLKALLIRSLAKTGERVEAVKLLDELQAESARRYVSSSALAIAYGALGEKDKAFAYLEKDIADRASRPPLFSISPNYDDLRDDPRFNDLVRRVEASRLD